MARTQTNTGFQFTTSEIDAALAAGRHDEELRTYFGPERHAALRSAAKPAGRRAASGPRVLILPGIMGSTIGTEKRFFDHLIWLNPFNIALGEVMELALDDAGEGDHTSLDAIPYYYYHLRRSLSGEGFNVDYHHFDWRHGLERLGHGLAERVRTDPASEVNLVAHSTR